jgi:Arc/MetJ family transcription regulator
MADPLLYISWLGDIYCGGMAKHLVDIDEQALRDARIRLGADTIKETVNRALRLAGGDRETAVKRRIDALAHADLAPREQAWR